MVGRWIGIVELELGLGWPNRAPIKGILLCSAQPSEGEAAFPGNGLVLLGSEGAMIHGAVVHAFVGQGHLEADGARPVSSQAPKHHPVLGWRVGTMERGTNGEEGSVASGSPAPPELDIPRGIASHRSAAGASRGRSRRGTTGSGTRTGSRSPTGSAGARGSWSGCWHSPDEASWDVNQAENVSSKQ